MAFATSKFFSYGQTSTRLTDPYHTSKIHSPQATESHLWFCWRDSPITPTHLTESKILLQPGAEDVLIIDSEKVLISDLGVMVLCWVLLRFLDLYRDMD
jgi:hypothetical protein